MVISVPESIDQSPEPRRRWRSDFPESDHDRQVGVCCCCSCPESGNRAAISKGVVCRLFHSFWPADRCSLFSFLPSLLTHRFAWHLDAVSVVHQPIEDAVSQCGISDLLVPAGHRLLRGQDHRACSPVAQLTEETRRRTCPVSSTVASEVGSYWGNCTFPSGAFTHEILSWPVRIKEFREFLRFLEVVARSYVFKLPALDSFDKAEHSSQTELCPGDRTGLVGLYSAFAFNRATLWCDTVRAGCGYSIPTPSPFLPTPITEDRSIRPRAMRV